MKCFVPILKEAWKITDILAQNSAQSWQDIQGNYM